MEPVIKKIAEKYAVSPGAIALSWIMQQSVVATVMSSNRDRARKNMDSMRIHLNNNEMLLITELTRKHLRLVSPPGLAPEWDE
jgi:diketogulonate reductase-like aldo/keto reductase